MQVRFVGPRSSEYRKFVAEQTKYFTGIHGAFDDTIWIELSNAVSDANEEFLAHFDDELARGFKVIRLLLQSHAVACPDAVFIYEALSMVLKVALERDAIVYLLTLTGNKQDNIKEIALSLIDQYGNTSETDAENNIVRFIGKLVFWDPQAFRIKCCSKCSVHIYEKQADDERQQGGYNLPDALQDWLRDDNNVFRHLNNRWENAARTALRTNNFMLSRTDLHRQYSTGRLDSYQNLINMLNPDFTEQIFPLEDATIALGDLPEQLRQLLCKLDSPANELVEQIQYIRKLIPTFYYPPIVNGLTKIESDAREVQIEGGFTDDTIPYNTRFWQNGALQNLSTGLTALIATIGQADTTRPGARLSLKREVRRQLQSMSATFAQQVNDELNDISGLQDVFRLSPQRAYLAFREHVVIECLLARFTALFSQLWGLRTFLGILPIPQQVQSLFYHHGAHMRYAYDMLAQMLRLLGFYYALFYMQTSYQEMFAQFAEELRQARREQAGCCQHSENIVMELNYHGSSSDDDSFDYQSINIRNINKAPEHFPESEDIENAFFEMSKNKLDEVNQMIAATRNSGQESEDILGVMGIFVPTVLHNIEAWLVAEQMAGTISNDQEFEKVFEREIVDSGISVEANAHYHTIKNPERVDLISDTELRSWKKKALEVMRKPLIEDVLSLKRLSDSTIFLQRLFMCGIDEGFWIQDGLDIWLSNDIYRIASDDMKVIFYQRKDGLTRDELDHYANTDMLGELQSWYRTFTNVRGELDTDLIRTGKDFFNKVRRLEIEESKTIHPYGAIAVQTNKTFMLKNTLVSKLMTLFAASDIHDAEPRVFKRTYLEAYLKRKDNESTLNEVFQVFFDYLILSDRKAILDKLISEGMFSASHG
jgi:hypothetical protein